MQDSKILRTVWWKRRDQKDVTGIKIMNINIIISISIFNADHAEHAR